MIDAGTAAKEHYARRRPRRHLDARRAAHLRADRHRLVRRRRLARLRHDRRVGPRDGQQLLDREGQFDTISIAAKEGTSPTELVDAIKPLIPDTLQVQDSAKQAEEDAKELNSGMDFLRCPCSASAASRCSSARS